MPDKDLAASLTETVTDKGGLELLAELSEVALDASLQDGLLKDVPILGSLIKLLRLGVGIKEYLFLKKLQKFASPIRDVSDEDREKFRKKLQEDDKCRERVGENLILLLDQLDDIGKAELIGKAFAAYLSNRIDYDTFARLSVAINRAYLPDLMLLKQKRYIPSWLVEDWLQQLAACGFLNTKAKSEELGANPTICYEVNRLGRYLLEICFPI